MSRKIEKFEDIEVWKEGMNLTVELYKLLSGCRDFGFRDQLQRAAVSIPSNIAEGYERNTNKEYIQFLYIAKGSCGELRTQLYLAEKLGYITSENANQMINKTRKISSMIYNLIKTRKEKF
ncbi:MAG: four helix bundle protein [Candidatus Marinimicrobia bacterium]|nr:four helix bundle protein [bacterium]MCG2716330.1 four helix bundle protein [Candidatus Neomarinimicrobiota bacterium]